MPKFMVTYNIRGTMTDIIEAETLGAAEVVADENCNNENWDPDIDTIDDVDFQVQKMHSVIRDGKRISTTYVRAGDELVAA